MVWFPPNREGYNSNLVVKNTVWRIHTKRILLWYCSMVGNDHLKINLLRQKMQR